MKENYIPYAPKEKTLDEIVESISQKALNNNNADLSNKIGTVKGLLSAHSVAPCEALMNKIAVELAKIIDELLLTPDNQTVITNIQVPKSYDVFASFGEYLKEQGMVTTTSAIYVRNVKRAIKNEKVSVSKDLFDKIQRLKSIIQSLEFDVNDPDTLLEICDLLQSIIAIKSSDETERINNKKDHGASLCALKRFEEFIRELAKQIIKNKNN